MLPVNMANILVADEDERLQELRIFNLERRLKRENSDPFGLQDILFIQRYRLNKDMAQHVLNIILPRIDVVDNAVAVSAVLKFFATLEFFATGSYQRTIGDNFNINMSQQVVSRAIILVTHAIVTELGNQYIIFPTTNAHKNEIKGRFMERTGFPGVVGAIDCTHVAILSPSNEEHNYLNRKGFHSKNIQLICDYDMKILNVNAQYAGATHDAFIWRNSAIRNNLQTNYQQGDRTSWLLGDSGYPLEPWLMTPFRNPQPESPEYRFNSAHIQARNCVERCFGLLKSRFRCLLKERVLRYSPEKVAQIFYGCSILHNICLNGNLNIEFEHQPLEDEVHNLNENVLQDAREGVDARRVLLNNYFLN